MRPRTLAALAVALVAVLAVSAPFFRSYTRSAALIVRMAGLQGPVQDALEWEMEAVTAYGTSVPSRHGRLRARLYVPDRVRRAIVLVAGVNALGIDEPRLYGLAQELANAGYAVLTPELPDLQRYDITARTTDMIEDAAVWLSSQPRLARDHRVGLVGISFAGGLSIVAAGRPALRDRAAFVFSFGGHSDFPRVLRYLCTGMEPTPPASDTAATAAPAEQYRRPHDYGVVIVLLGLADRLVPPEQVGPLRAAILTYLRASHYDLIDKRKAAVVFAEARQMAAALPEPARSFMQQVNDRAVDRLGPTLLPHIARNGQEPALSPERSPAPVCPVYLLHGSEDNVVPALESLWLSKHLEGRVPVRTLLSQVITHAELDSQHGWREIWQLVDFFASLLRE
jgi:dienelactone hydrolase